MDWSVLGLWDGYKPPRPCFNRGRAPSLRDNGYTPWTPRCCRRTSPRRTLSTSSSPSPNLKLWLLLIQLAVGLASLRTRRSNRKLGIHFDDLLGIFWRPFRKNLNPKREIDLRRRPLSQRSCLRRHRQTRRSSPPALTPAIKTLHPWRTPQ